MNYYTMFYENGLTILLAIIGFIIVLWAQIKVKGNYNKYKQIQSSKSLTGAEVARMILDKNGLNNVHIVSTSGELSDHYDPSRKVVRLSKDIFDGTSVASIAVAAHECGHAIQDKDNYTFMRIRGVLVPFVNLVSYLGYFVMIFSIFIGMTGYFMVGIIMILATIIFQLVTLPVEFDASKRAGIQLKELGLINDLDQQGVKEMLKAAAMTYVASLISSIISLLRLVIMLNNNNNDD